LKIETGFGPSPGLRLPGLNESPAPNGLGHSATKNEVMPKEKHPQNTGYKGCSAPAPKPATLASGPVTGGIIAAVRTALTDLFEKGEWEIPDDWIEGKVTARIQQLEARVSAQANRIAELQAKVDGKPGATTRVDALETKPAKK
jgi:hypothetical protein